MPNYLDDVDKAYDVSSPLMRSIRRRVKDLKDAEMPPVKAPAEEKKDACASKKKDQLCPECGKEPCICETDPKKEMPPGKEDTSKKKKDEVPPMEKKEDPKAEKKEDPEMKKKEEEKKKQDSIVSIPKSVQDQLPKQVFDGFAHINDGLVLLKDNLKDAVYQDIITKLNSLRDELANTIQSKLEYKK